MRARPFLLAILALAPSSLAAQRPWNDSATMALVQRATARRAEQLADTGLVDYHAKAHGYLTFLAQFGEGLREPPQVVKADELGLEVFWKAPDLSKQRIMGRRDTLLLPTDINYHRDHLGIVQNNFPSTIRVGEGDEVADVPHPLSAQGIAAYDFAIADSLSIRLPDRRIDVVQVDVRPKDDRLARVIGAVFIDRGEAQVVRMTFSFTRAAYLDKDLEDVTIVLENALVGARFWLPRRQEVEIRRTGSWMDFPARGIIRGRWEICCYDLNTGLSTTFFAGPEIVQVPRALQERYPWSGNILDSLPPDVRAPTDADVARVQEEARALVRAEALARARQTALSARAVSDFVRVNRAEGLAVGAGLTRRLGGGLSASLGGRWGFADHQPKGEAALGWQRASGAGMRLRAFRAYRDLRIEPERSGVANTIAAQEFGSDATDPIDVRGAALRADLGTHAGLRWSLEGAFERQRALRVAAVPATNRYDPLPPADRGDARRLTLALDRPTVLAPFGTELRARVEASAIRRDGSLTGDRRLLRLAAVGNVERPFGSQRLVFHTTLGVATGSTLAPQELFWLGGPTSAPGYGLHDFVGATAGTAHVEWRLPVSFVSMTLGRYGRTPARATLAPFVHTAYVARGGTGNRFSADRAGWSPSLGLGGLALFDLLRVDVARGLRNGRWTVSVDVGRELWSVL